MSDQTADKTYEFGATPVEAEPATNGMKSAPAQPPRSTPLDRLRKEVGQKIARSVTLEVPGRPGWSVRYAGNLDYDRLAIWTKGAKDKQAPDGVNEAVLGRTILVNQCEAILYEGEIVYEIDGDDTSPPLTFQSQTFRDLVGAERPVDAVVAWYELDGHISAASEAVLNAAGFGKEAVEAPDPTKRR